MKIKINNFMLALLANNCSDEGALRYKSTVSYLLQICIGGKWNYICAKPGSNQWGENEARVACYQMGMSWQDTYVYCSTNLICINYCLSITL